MNREILFRGKRTDNGEWIEGNLLRFCWKTDILTYIATIDFNPFDTERTTFRVVPETVGQFTGLTDKNGVRIFEGDIVKNIDGIYVVRYCKNLTRFALVHDGMMSGRPVSSGTVIGNIHDNPGLLEENEDE